MLNNKPTDGALIPSLFPSLKDPIDNGIEDAKNEAINKVAEPLIETAKEKFSINNMLGVDEKLKELEQHLRDEARLTPDPNDDNIDYIQQLRDFADGALFTRFAPNWFKDLVIYFMAVVAESSSNIVNSLCKLLYQFITSVVLWTPAWLFENGWFSSSVATISGASIGIVSLVSMIEGLKRICRFSFTPFRHTLKRLPLALSVSAATPFMFTWGVTMLNKITKVIMSLSGDEIANSKLDSVSSIAIMFEPLHVLMMVVFLGFFIWYSFPLLIFHARRWFKMLVVGICTPLAMSAYLFKSTEKYFDYWLNTIKDLASIQIIYAVFVSILGLLMFATPTPTTLMGVFSKLLVSLGGLYYISNPPSIISRHFDTGKSGMDMFKDMKNTVGKMNNRRKSVTEKTDKGLIGGATIAGKVYRKFFKR